MRKIKVFIVDQSISVCKQLEDMLLTYETVEVVGIATEIVDATEYLKTTSPNLMLLDVNLPTESEKTALEIMLDMKAIPVIVLSDDSVQQTAKTVQAMANGAVDFIKKTIPANSKDQYEREVLSKITQAISTKRIRSTRRNQPINHGKQLKIRQENRKKQQSHTRAPIIAIGTSTGGPRALQRIIEGIPKDFPAPILIVQHMPATFTKSLAVRLNKIGQIRVKEATNNEVIKKGTAYIAPGNYHMQVKQIAAELRIEINQEKENVGHRPSVDILFKSLAMIDDIHKIAVVLTGMGKDGAEGVKKIKQLDDEAIIIAESRETAIIDGMPSAAIATNSVTEVIRLDEIAKALIEYSK
ncbi:chemotaxis-specific protein-glutamate methyltransferase CheB [Pseudogracilibacillus auburnensis]|uniref:chemotaxis-specific protein-glutamate methyltransferase CheB n=1 Tax=Pseudogracilibacillus auburnensis TaxID=1494959 RepID=UPI001A975F42|nr:chemotaxis-specific protein-glutamate methyltransferase CheB [Pseudogracilibacillus auburnensis]MBO1003787.1 chemotaxis-specific protein-glutamate methyltransferase CheB [Pseudogracilibacillus auburnensis]